MSTGQSDNVVDDDDVDDDDDDDDDNDGDDDAEESLHLGIVGKSPRQWAVWHKADNRALLSLTPPPVRSKPKTKTRILKPKPIDLTVHSRVKIQNQQ